MLISAFTNSDHWYLNEIRTIMLGRCTITCHLPAIKALDYMALESGYELNSTFNYQVSQLVVTLEKSWPTSWFCMSLIPITTLHFLRKIGGIKV